MMGYRDAHKCGRCGGEYVAHTPASRVCAACKTDQVRRTQVRRTQALPVRRCPACGDPAHDCAHRV